MLLSSNKIMQKSIKLGDRLGEGAYSNVFKGELTDEKTKQVSIVAVKVLKSTMEPQMF